MLPPPPGVLLDLLVAQDAAAEERAWVAFLDGYSGLLLHVARALGGDEDAVMDRYAYVLEALRRDGYRRLRGYATDGRGQFVTWLVIVVRRLCLDEYRHRYGRPQGDGAAGSARWAQRRSLARLVAAQLELVDVADDATQAPDAALQSAELRVSLERALAQLDASDRLLLRLRFDEGLSVPEIARALGQGSPFPLYRRIDKLLLRLRSALLAVGVSDPRP